MIPSKLADIKLILRRDQLHMKFMLAYNEEDIQKVAPRYQGSIQLKICSVYHLDPIFLGNI